MRSSATVIILEWVRNQSLLKYVYEHKFQMCINCTINLHKIVVKLWFHENQVAESLDFTSLQLMFIGSICSVLAWVARFKIV